MISKTEKALRLRVFWGDILYDTRLLEAKGRLSIGSKFSNDYVLDVEGLSAWELAKYDGKNLTLQLRPSPEGFFDSQGEATPLRLVEKRKKLVPSKDGGTFLSLVDGEMAEVTLGECTFSFDWVSAGEKVKTQNIVNASNLIPPTAIGSLLAGLWFLTVALPTTPEISRQERVVTLVRSEPKPEPMKVPEPAEVQPVESKPEVYVPSESRVKPQVPGPKKSTTTSKVTKVAPPDPFAAQAKSEWEDLGAGLSDLGDKRPRARTTRTGPAEGVGAEKFEVAATEAKITETVGQGTGTLRTLTKDALSEPSTPNEGKGLERAVIESYVRERQPRLTGCFERSDVSTASLTLGFTIRADGGVSSIRVLDDTAHSKLLTQCVTAEVRSWRFPRSASGQPTQVEYPFSFQKR